MKRVLAIALLLCASHPRIGQTKGRVSVGGTVTYVIPTDGEVGSLVGVGPLVRLNPKKGWGIAGGLSWFRADIDNPDGAGDFARLRVRPLMAGVAYTIGEQPVLISFSIVAGPSFNDLDFHDDFLDRCRLVPSRSSTRKTASLSVLASGSRGPSRRAWRSSGSAATRSTGRTSSIANVSGAGVPQSLECGLDSAERRRGLLALLRIG